MNYEEYEKKHHIDCISRAHLIVTATIPFTDNPDPAYIVAVYNKLASPTVYLHQQYDRLQSKNEVKKPQGSGVSKKVQVEAPNAHPKQRKVVKSETRQPLEEQIIKAIGKEDEGLIYLEVKESHVEVHPKKFLGIPIFNRINQALWHTFGAKKDYVSAKEKSHWRVSK
jgi:hypothetical protein